MIDKITQIKNLSRFKHFSSTHDDISLKKTNLIYALNGRGKTSISDIIYSLYSNNPSLLQVRASKVYPGNPEVTVLHSGETTSRFASSAWSNQPANIKCLVFDKSFIQKNIHTITVEHEHKKKLHGLIVGESADKARGEIKSKRGERTAAYKELEAITNNEYPGLGIKNLSVDEFSSITSEDSAMLEAQKKSCGKQLEALGDPAAVKIKQELDELVRQDLNIELLEQACRETSDDGSKEASELIERHIKTHVHGTPEETKAFMTSAVKAQGTKETPNCALCGQEIKGPSKDLIAALFSIFNRRYLDIRRKVKDGTEILQQFDEQLILSRFTESMELNASRYTDWSKYINQLPKLAEVQKLNGAIADATSAKTALINKLENKQEDATIVIAKELEDLKDSLAALDGLTTAYNASAESINKEIAAYKAGLKVDNKQEVINQLEEINTKLLRNSPVGNSLIKRYRKASKKASDADDAYRQALGDFTASQEEIINKHKDEINKLLKDCGAKFQLNDIAQGRRTDSTEPYLEYSFELTGGENDARVGATEGISSVLSEGEKNLLAFAFFWSLVVHQDLASTIVIFDDPLSSVDADWRTCMAEKLKELVNRGIVQLFVLTHYDDFAQITTRVLPGVKELTIVDKGRSNGNVIAGVNIEDIVREEQFRRIGTFAGYIADPSSQPPGYIQAEMRKILECALKHRYYRKLEALINNHTSWLRNYIDHPEVKPILEDNGTYNELDTLCIAGGWANHDNPSATRFTQSEAESYAQRTLDILEKL